MSPPFSRKEEPIRLSLPATSANLGPGFDAVGLALSLSLQVTASASESFSIDAAGRDKAVVGAMEGNLILETYRDILQAHDRPLVPLALSVDNGIPLGMGLGSSAAALCAGVMLANHFGALGWSLETVAHEAAVREGHPDNVAACIFGGLTVSRTLAIETSTASFGQDLPWRLLLALPKAALSTKVARALLPNSYSRADVIASLQGTAMLVSAFAQGRPELLRSAAGDLVHEPYRKTACPLFAALQPLATEPGVFSVTLSGAGPSTLLIVDESFDPARIEAVSNGHLSELLPLNIGSGASFGPAFHRPDSQSLVTVKEVT